MNIKYAIITILAFVGIQSAKAQTVECEDTCRHIHGIDISHHQNAIFWEALGNNGKMAYVYMKCTEGGNFVDKRFEENIQQAHRNGLKVGSYHFWRPRVPQQLQFENFTTQCRRNEQDLIPMVDVEVASGMGAEELNDSLFKFLSMVEKHYRQKPIIYTGRNFYETYFMGKFAGYKVMIAQYSKNEPVLKDGFDYTCWQYTEKGHINGVNGYVDKSRFVGRHTLRELRYRRR